VIQQKICLVGSSAVGKTSLIRRFVDGVFSDRYLTTIGVKVDKKQIQIEQEQIQLMVWDIEGIDQYHHFQPRYLRGAAAVVLVADQSRENTMTEALSIYFQLREIMEAPVFLVLNKADLDSRLSDIDKLKECPFKAIVSTSAKTGDNVELMFDIVAKTLMEGFMQHG